jgi:hypothetical protein
VVAKLRPNKNEMTIFSHTKFIETAKAIYKKEKEKLVDVVSVSPPVDPKEQDTADYPFVLKHFRIGMLFF